MGQWVFEVATIEVFPYCSVRWGDMVVIPPPTKRDEMLGHLEALGDLADVLRGSAGGGQLGPDALVGGPPGGARTGSLGERYQPRDLTNWRPSGWV